MRIESNLCHISENKAIVKVNGWINDKNLGSALAEGSTVELAEDKAISRLNQRLNITTNYVNNTKLNNENKVKTPLDDVLPKSKILKNDVKTPFNDELPNSQIVENNNSNQEPSDWSNELTAIDSEIERLKWSRDDEISFLQENFSYNNRNKITNYKDIVNYLSLLKKIDRLNSSKLINQNVKTLIEDSDRILMDLSWDHKQGREYLQKEFNVSTRKELNEKQLISFVAKLKTIRNQNLNK
tara:strand:+ start:164 stop:886 length:723 start_codon:yes stop_codon:yes gene_type:complete